MILRLLFVSAIALFSFHLIAQEEIISDSYFIKKEKTYTWKNRNDSVIIDILNPQEANISGKINGEVFNSKVNIRIGLEGYIHVYLVEGKYVCLYLESLGITESFRINVNDNSEVELWNPDWNGGTYNFYVDWEKLILYTINTNSDKDLPDNFKIVITENITSGRKSQVIGFSFGKIEFIKVINNEFYYKKFEGPTDKVGKEIVYSMEN